MANQDGKPGKPDESKLRIVQHGKQQRATVTMPLVVGEDDDLIDALNELPSDQRQKAIKSAIRSGMGWLAPQPEQSLSPVLERLDWLVEQVTWIADQFQKLREYLDDKFSAIRVVAGAMPQQPPQTDKSQEGLLSQEDMEERRANLKKKGRGW